MYEDYNADHDTGLLNDKMRKMQEMLGNDRYNIFNKIHECTAKSDHEDKKTSKKKR